MSLSITVDVAEDATLETVIEDAISAAKSTGLYVNFVFKGVELRVSSTSSLQNVYNIYVHKLENKVIKLEMERED